MRTSAKARLTSQDPNSCSWSPPKFNHLFIGLLPKKPNLPWKFHANPFGSFFLFFKTQTNNDDYVTSLAEVNIRFVVALSVTFWLYLYNVAQVCVVTSRLYIADVQSVWSVRTPSAWARQHIHDVYPMSLSVTDARLLVTCRSGHRLIQFGVDGKLLRRVCMCANTVSDITALYSAPSCST